MGNNASENRREESFVELVMAPRVMRDLITHCFRFRPLGSNANLNDSDVSLQALQF